MFAPETGGSAGDAFAGIGSAIGGIVLAADSGSFSVTPEAGKSLLNAIDDLHAAVDSALAKSSSLGQEPALGNTPAAKVYKPFLATIATDPTQGALPVFKKLQSDLINARAAIQKAMQNYDDAEQANTGSLKGTWT